MRFNKTSFVPLLASLTLPVTAFGLTCASWVNSNSSVMDSAATRPDEAGNWMLVCKAAAGMKTVYEVNPGRSSSFTRYMRKAATGAGLRGERLNAGECAWPDRPLNTAEHSALLLQLSCEPEQRYTIERESAELKMWGTAFTFLDSSGDVYGFYVRRMTHAWAVVGKFYRLGR